MHARNAPCLVLALATGDLANWFCSALLLPVGNELPAWPRALASPTGGREFN
jgi:poly-beta-hydroxyalkanoate depolymerase